MRLPLTVRWTTGAAVGETSTESRDVSSRGVVAAIERYEFLRGNEEA